MPRFSQESERNLETCHQSIQCVLRRAIDFVDFKVLEGHRTTERQQKLFAQGRTIPGKIVTNIDGISRKSRHQTSPSEAVDIAPYPVDWNDHERFYELAGWIQAIAALMNIRLQWGGHWKRFKDLPHWEIDR